MTKLLSVFILSGFAVLLIFGLKLAEWFSRKKKNGSDDEIKRGNQK
jgi:hypothetical protein